MNNHVALQYFVERIIAENNLRRDDLRAADREWIERELESIAQATKLQAREYERRLDILNHAHEMAKEVLGTYIPREMYEKAIVEIVEWQRKAEVKNVETDARIKSVELGLVNLPGGIKSLELGLASQSAQQIGSRMTMSTAITIVGTLVVVGGLIVALLSYMK